MDNNNNIAPGMYGEVLPEAPSAEMGFQPPLFDEKKARKHFSGIGMSYLIFMLTAVAAQFLLGLVLERIWPDAFDDYLVNLLSSLLPMYIVGGGVCYLCLRRVSAEKPAAAEKWNALQVIGGFIIAYSMMYLGNIVGTIIGTVIEMFNPSATAATNDVQTMVLTGDMAVNIIFMVIIGPIFEELFFRKFLCDRLKAYGEWVTIIVTGLMFGIFHGNLTQCVYAFLLGGFLAYAYLKTGKISLTIGYHMVINFFGSVVPLVVLTAFSPAGFADILETGDINAVTEYVTENLSSFALFGFYIVMVFGLIITGIVLITVALCRNRIHINPGRIRIPAGKRFSTVIVNLGMMLFIIIGIAFIIIEMFI